MQVGGSDATINGSPSDKSNSECRATHTIRLSAWRTMILPSLQLPTRVLHQFHTSTIECNCGTYLTSTLALLIGWYSRWPTDIDNRPRRVMLLAAGCHSLPGCLRRCCVAEDRLTVVATESLRPCLFVRNDTASAIANTTTAAISTVASLPIDLVRFRLSMMLSSFHSQQDRIMQHSAVSAS